MSILFVKFFHFFDISFLLSSSLTAPTLSRCHALKSKISHFLRSSHIIIPHKNEKPLFCVLPFCYLQALERQPFQAPKL